MSAGVTGPTAPPAGATPAGKPPGRVQVAWTGARRFDVTRAGLPPVRLDGDGKAGPTPVDALLGALGACVSVDVVDILAKRRTPVETFAIEVVGERARTVPARVTRIELRIVITGTGIERVHAERAIELAVTKYCSVRDSLDPKIPVEWRLTLNGEE